MILCLNGAVLGYFVVTVFACSFGLLLWMLCKFNLIDMKWRSYFIDCGLDQTAGAPFSESVGRKGFRCKSSYLFFFSFFLFQCSEVTAADTKQKPPFY